MILLFCLKQVIFPYVSSDREASRVNSPINSLFFVGLMSMVILHVGVGFDFIGGIRRQDVLPERCRRW